VKQAADETVINFFSRANKIMWDLKSNIHPTTNGIPDVVLPAAMAAKCKGLDLEVRDTVVNHVRQHSLARSLEQYNAMILLDGFKPSKTAKKWNKLEGASRH
jgi:hypothetical protein